MREPFHHCYAYNSMPITTRTVSKGIPPKLHKPKTRAKARTSKPKKSGKRVASESDSESESEEELVKKKMKHKKQPRVDSRSEVEVELVDGDDEPAEKEIDDQLEEEVSKDYLPICKKLTKFLGG